MRVFFYRTHYLCKANTIDKETTRQFCHGGLTMHTFIRDIFYIIGNIPVPGLRIKRFDTR